MNPLKLYLTDLTFRMLQHKSIESLFSVVMTVLVIDPITYVVDTRGALYLLSVRPSRLRDLLTPVKAKRTIQGTSFQIRNQILEQAVIVALSLTFLNLEQ